MRFSFTRQQWGEVIEYFAKQADYSLIMDVPPPGSFSYTDTKEFYSGTSDRFAQQRFDHQRVFAGERASGT